MSSAVKRERIGHLVDRDESERLSADDLATVREAEFLADALRAQQLQAEREAAAPRGVCVNCGERCLPRAVYCDEDCKADHEARVAAQRRAGRSG